MSARLRSVRALIASMFVAPLAGTTGCSVEPIAEKARPAVVNTCSTDNDCGSRGFCSNGACYSRSTSMEEVALEIIPDTNSTLGGKTFYSVQTGLRRGTTTPRTITLSGPVSFTAQVEINGEELDPSCGYPQMVKPSIAARVLYVRTGSVGNVAVTDLSRRDVITVDTERNASGFSKSVSLLPGVYDVYVQPLITATATCLISPKLWRNVEVGRDGRVDSWAPPATMDLSAPRKLSGTVERRGGDLADWQVDLIDPQDGYVISTSRRLGVTTDTAPVTNFDLYFQPLEVAGPLAYSATKAPPTGPVIRLRPPKDAEASTPTVYFDLEATDLGGTGKVNLIVSKIPRADQRVTVSGQVHGSNTAEGVRATVKFVSVALDGLVTSYAPAVPTDATGHYSTQLFPGEYRIVVAPEVVPGNTMTGTNSVNKWATTTESRTRSISTEPDQAIDFSVLPRRIVEGTASAGKFGVAQGATLEAAPLRSTLSGIFQNIIAPAAPQAITTFPVNDDDGRFELIVDPGYYDLTLKPSPASNFAWWVLPGVHVIPVDEPDVTGRLDPELLYPVRFDGLVTIATTENPRQPLGNATVNAYARPSATSAARQVGTARTDDMGRYYLALPPGFAALR